MNFAPKIIKTPPTTWSQKDDQYTWHPFTQHGSEPQAPVIVRGQGASLFDENGREIIDCISSWWTCTHGHCHPELTKALKDQVDTLDHVIFSGFTHPPAIQLAETIINKLPNSLNRVFYADSGSMAVEIALKMAIQLSQNRNQNKRQTLIAFDKGYHGETFGAMAVGKKSGYFKPFENLMFDVKFMPYPATWNNDPDHAQKNADALETYQNYLESHGDEIIGVIVEPLMQGAGGIRLCDPSFIRDITNSAQEKDITIIFDEIAVGFGRTGTLFAHEQCNVTPDIICLSKGLTGGMLPLSLAITSEKIFQEFYGAEYDKAFAHSNSFTGNPLACALAVRAIELFDEDNTFEKIKNIETLHHKFAKELHNIDTIHQVRVKGTILAFNLKNGGGYKSSVSEEMRFYFLREGFNIRPIGDVIYIMPPYCITPAQLQSVYDVILKGLKKFL